MVFIPIAQWTQVKTAFQHFFAGLGQVNCTEHNLQFFSPPEDVQTTFQIARPNGFTAEMPLHQLHGDIEKVAFDSEEHAVHVRGPALQYTYKVPAALLRKRRP